jgi:hypothetical protein
VHPILELLPCVDYSASGVIRSRAVILLFVVTCCFLGSGVLPRKGADVPERNLTQQNQIRDVLPLERSWLDLAVVDPRSYLCYFN